MGRGGEGRRVMSALYVVRDGDSILTSPGGDPYEIATVVLMNALVSGKKPEIVPASSLEEQTIPRRRNVRLSIEISVDADASSRLPAFEGSVGLDDVLPPEDGLEIEAALLENEIIGLIVGRWRERLDALVEETRVAISGDYAPEPSEF